MGHDFILQRVDLALACAKVRVQVEVFEVIRSVAEVISPPIERIKLNHIITRLST